ncbi:MAG: glycine zipper 2TM domain-containing protein, partial [Aliarcobacter sp.]|nr:glycine zipper 2TM domain-containing protein [Aliarcobacter sp.]
TIVGATIGVAIGNQIGRGNGKDVARVAGGLLGATIANNSRDTRDYNDNYNNNNSYNNYERTRTYVRDDYYDDRYYYSERRPIQSQVIVVYKDYDRAPPYRRDLREYHPPRHHGSDHRWDRDGRPPRR